MKRFVWLLIILVGLLGAGFTARMAMAVPPPVTSDITVTIPEYIGVEGLVAITITVSFAGSPATGSGSNTDGFTVEANVNTTIGVGTIVQPTTPTPLTGLTGSVSPLSGTPGSTAVVLTASISAIPLSKVAGNYTGGSIQVTAVKTP